MTEPAPHVAGDAEELISDSDWVAVRRRADGAVRVTIKWAVTRWILLAGFIPGLIVGLALGVIS